MTRTLTALATPPPSPPQRLRCRTRPTRAAAASPPALSAGLPPERSSAARSAPRYYGPYYGGPYYYGAAPYPYGCHWRRERLWDRLRLGDPPSSGLLLTRS